MAIHDDDLAAVLVELERRLSRHEIAAALEVDERELDEIASGYLPSRDVARRLRALAAGGAEPGTTRRIPRGVIIAFVAADLLFFGIVAAVVLLR